MKIDAIEGGSLGTNCYIVSDGQKAVLFDFVPEAADFIRKHGLTVDYIFMTHIHFDHFEGLADYRGQNKDFKIVISRSGLENINNGSKSLALYVDPFSRPREVDMSGAKVVEDGDCLEWNGRQIRCYSAPGHSEDSMVYIIDDLKSVISGDTLFYMSVGRTDFPGGSYEKLMFSITRYLDMVDDDYLIYPGHGPSTVKKNELKYNQYLKNK